MSQSMTRKTILVTGSTGQQGRSLIQALLSDPRSNDFAILALTRNTSSPVAQKLASQSENITLAQGDLNSLESVRKIFENAKETADPIWGAFCVLAYPGLGANADDEERQGKTLADLALEFRVSSFVFSSVERGGEAYDDHYALDRKAKINIERHVRELGKQGLPWTILRPGFFMENYDGFIGSITTAVLKNALKPTTTMQLIAIDDIGHVAAGVFKNPEEFNQKILRVVGEESTLQEQAESYKRATGHALPAVPWLFARILRFINSRTIEDVVGEIERIHRMRHSGECPNDQPELEAAQRAYPHLKSFEEWAKLKTSSPAAGERKKNWNQVSIVRLLTGKL